MNSGAQSVHGLIGRAVRCPACLAEVVADLDEFGNWLEQALTFGDSGTSGLERARVDGVDRRLALHVAGEDPARTMATVVGSGVGEVGLTTPAGGPDAGVGAQLAGGGQLRKELLVMGCESVIRGGAGTAGLLS